MTWDLANNLNWDRVLTKTYYAQPITTDGSQFKPIPTITALVDSYTLLIGCRNTQAKSNWYLAGHATSRLLFSPSSTSDFTAAVQSYSRVKLGLERLTLVRFKDFNLTPFLLEINIAKWHKEMFVEVWKYSKEPNNVEDDLARIENTLERIEYKLDTTTQ